MANVTAGYDRFSDIIRFLWNFLYNIKCLKHQLHQTFTCWVLVKAEI